MKIILFAFLSFVILNAQNLKPTYTLTASGGVTDLVYKKGKLFVATTNSSVNIFNIKTKKLIKKIELPKIKDFAGDVVASKIYSVDALDNSILILSQGERGGRAIDIYKDEKLHSIISDKKRMFIARAKFISKDKIIFSLLSNQLYYYDLNKKEAIYIKQISQSKFSHFKLDETKKRVIIADESGELKEINIESGEVVKNYSGYNLDNVFQVDWKNNIIITAGQDRRAVVYNQGQPYYKSVDFLIYSCALSPSGKIASFSSDEDNNVTVFNTKTKKELYKLTNNKMTLSSMVFLNENELFIASDDKTINNYKLK